MWYMGCAVCEVFNCDCAAALDALDVYVPNIYG